jgi:hypothetical protein
VTYWLKAIGHAKGPLPGAWLEEGRLDSLRRTGFPRRPRMQEGDRLVYYASVWRCVFAVVEVVGAPEETRPGTRWPWTVAVAAARDPAARPRAADRGDRRPGPLDEPAVAHPALI